MHKKLFLILIALLGTLAQQSKAAKIDTVSTTSLGMHRQIKAVVITPDDYQKNSHYAVVYLLHGYSGNYADWIKKVPAIQGLADLYNFIIVCPDGGFASWYIDSPEKKESQYDTYISKELVEYIDANYATIKDRSGRAITGLSMGGFGALYLAIRHQDTFGAVGSMSGGVDLRPFADKFGINEVLGDIKTNPQRFTDYSIPGILGQLKPGSLAITIDDGSSDFFLAVNTALHEQLLQNKIDHDFCIRPGGHTWEFWGNAVEYQMTFFSKFFKRNPQVIKAQQDAENWKNWQKSVDERMRNDWASLNRYADADSKLAAPLPAEKRVVFTGNSITDNWYNTDSAFFKTNHYIGRGIGGQTSSQILLRFREDIINLKPVAVVISAGTNDIAQNTGPISLENVFGNIVSMVELSKASGIKPILTSVLPASEFPWHPGLQPAGKIIKLNAMIKSYAIKNHLVYVDYWSAMKNEKDGMKAELSMDGFVHPNMQGYKVMEPLVNAGIRQALASK